MTRTRVRLSMVLGLLLSSAASAGYHGWFDLSALGGQDFQLQVALYDNSGVTGDSWAWLDNVVVGAVVEDFELGTVGGFDGSWNPAGVQAVAGSLDGAGSYLLQLTEDPLVTPTLAFRNYAGSGGSVLTLDFELVSSGAAGPLGPDELVFSLLDPQTLDPLVSGLTGLGEMLAVRADGLTPGADVTVTIIPAPSALVLGLLGAGGLGLWRRRGPRV